MNEVLQCMEKRYTCRAYDGKMPKKEELDAIAAAAVQSPSAVNAQPWEIVGINDKGLIDRMDAAAMGALALAEDKSIYDRMMDRGGKLFYNAPCMFLVLMRQGKEMDAGIVAQNIALAATSLGLGSTICGLAAIPFTTMEAEAFRQEIGITQGWEFGIAVLVGSKATEEGAPHEPDMEKVRFLVDG